ncbi:MAG: DUF167 domain-containing protein [Chloroflexota bacterium]
MTILRIHVQPGASRNEITGWEGDLLRVRLRARAIEGKANKSLVEFLAESLGLRPRQVALLRGERSREKLVEVDLPSLEEVAARLRQ